MSNRNEFRDKDMAKAALLYVQAQAEIGALRGEVERLESIVESQRTRLFVIRRWAGEQHGADDE